jgi:hypothetical protein
VDGTLTEAWAGQNSFKPRTDTPPASGEGDAGSCNIDFHNQKRTNNTHASTMVKFQQRYVKSHTVFYKSW